MMTDLPIYTIGYGNRPIEEFVALLRRYEIEYLVDVRSHPYSRYRPEFRKEDLQAYLELFGIQYVFAGDQLGGRPRDTDCYTGTQVDYDKLRKKDFYQAGIERLQMAWAQDARMALMCAELRPQHCHRALLIGQTLADRSFTVLHIDGSGELKTQAEVMLSAQTGD
jgi:uncharacterized protein (DUF488 family)